MAWSEKLASGKHRGGYRDRNGNLCYTPETYTQGAEAQREAGRLEDKSRKRFKYRKNVGKQLYRSWVAEWWPKRDVEPSTKRPDWIRMEKHILPRWGDTPLEELEQDREGIQDWVNDLRDSALSASTVAKIKALLSASLKAAMLAEPPLIEVNPCTSIKLPPIPPSDERYLERDEYTALRAELPTRQVQVLADFLVGTGLRWGEAVAVHRPRIHQATRSLDVLAAFDAEDGTIKPYPKGKKKRSVPLEDALLAGLLRWMGDTPARCSTPHRKGSICRGGLLFADEHGMVVDYFHFEQYVWRPAVKRAKVGPLRIHDLRHTYASWLRQDGVPLDEIQALLGHESPQTTQRYAHIGTKRWDTIRDALRGKPADPDPVAQVAVLEDLAKADPERWGPVLAAARAALEGAGSGPDGDAAPDLLRDDLHGDGAKIIQIGRKRRSS